MIELSMHERIIWRLLRDRARSATHADPIPALITYGELGRLADPDGTWRYPMSRPPFRGLNEALGHVSMYEVEHGRPMPTALVVSVDHQKPGDGFAKLARHLGFTVDDPEKHWTAELERTVDFWSADDPVLVLDAAMDRVLSELAVIKQRLRTRAALSDQ